MDGYYAAKAEHDRTKELAGQVLKVVNNELKKDKRKVKKLNQELADAESADDYRIRGELLIQLSVCVKKYHRILAQMAYVPVKLVS